MIDVTFSPTAPTQRPIFLFAASHRCGSTLLQRLLNSCPDILIWGEQNGYLNAFVRDFRDMLDWQSRVGHHRQTFLQKGYDNFIPNLMPEAYELRGAAVAYLGALFGVPAARLGRSTWGFKEVRYGIQVALLLQECFPKARFIHLNRHIVDCLISLKHWEDSPDPWNRQWTRQSVANWERINGSFLRAGAELTNLLSVRYEDMIAGPQAFIQQLAHFLELSPAVFDHKVFNKRLHSAGEASAFTRRKIRPADLDAEERALITTTGILEIAEAYGYKMEFGRS
jgi:hypothetical protein